MSFLLSLLALALALAVSISADHDPNVDLLTLTQGNQNFRSDMAANHPGLLESLAVNGQHPPFMLLGCSDSRVSEGTIFSAEPGTIFAERNIANQFHQSDSNTNSVLAYAISELHVEHIIVLGHYGCGGVAAAIASPPPGSSSTAIHAAAQGLDDGSVSVDAVGSQGDDAASAVQQWIQPIRDIYETSNRSEIVAMRNNNTNINTNTNASNSSINEEPASVNPPGLHDPGYRALVEENVKSTVQNIVNSKLVTDYRSSASHPHAPPTPQQPASINVHGWVYDVETGAVRDLNVGVSLAPGRR